MSYFNYFHNMVRKIIPNSRHFGTGTNRHLCETFRYQDKLAPQLDKSAPQFRQIGILILRTKLPIALNQFQILIMSGPLAATL